MESLKDKKILITGGTGFLATNLAKYLLDNGCEYIRLTSRDEVKQANRFEEFNRDNRLNYILSDVRNPKSTEYSLNNIDICIHTAAYKRIDMGERSPMEFIDTNIIGTKNVIDACIKNNVEKAIFISSDKACKPISLYGSTKFTAEKLWTFANQYSGAEGTKFASVRYGNVFKSTGSLYYIFKKQTDEGKVFTITNLDMTRFFMTIQNAIDTIIFAIKNTKGNGEVYVPKCPSFKITDLARAFSEDLPFKIVGLRGIEKIHETIISEEELIETNDLEEYYEILPIHPIHKNRSNYPHRNWEDCYEHKSLTNDKWLSVEELRKYL